MQKLSELVDDFEIKYLILCHLSKNSIDLHQVQKVVALISETDAE
jgi:hypothetical protein